jgi:CRP/FNR family transcriptional regulator, cyclic AMP receptor protein
MPAWSLLSLLSDEEARQVRSGARRRRFGRGEVVFHREDPADTMHLVSQGCFAIRVITPLGDVATLGLVGPGECFGELALVRSHHARTATVEAVTPSETLVLSNSDLAQLRRTHPQLDQELINLLGDRVSQLTDRLVEALYTPAPQRVARILDDLAERYRDPSGNATIPLTQDDLAGLAGTSRLTVHRVLHDPRHRDRIHTHRGRITITPPP